MPPQPTTLPADLSRARRRVGLWLTGALLFLAGLGALFARRPEPVGPLAEISVLSITTNAAGLHVANIQVSNRLNRSLAWLPIGQLETDPDTNRAALHLPGCTNVWILPPRARREFAFAIDHVGSTTPWLVALYARPWRGHFGDALERGREWARIRGVPLPLPRYFERIPSPWTPPLRAAVSRPTDSSLSER